MDNASDQKIAEVTGTITHIGDGLDIRLDDFSAYVHAAEEGGYWAEVPALPGCITEGETLDELVVNLNDAVVGWLEVQTPESLTALGVRFSPVYQTEKPSARQPRVRSLEFVA